MKRRALFTLAALLGIALSAAVAWSATRLASQHIGLSNEPLSVAAGLAPARTTPPAVSPSSRHTTAGATGRRARKRSGRPTVTLPVAPARPSAPPTAPTLSTPTQSATPSPTRPANQPSRQGHRDDSRGGGGSRDGGGSQPAPDD